MMRVGIIQPNFIPWRGYFDFIASVDCFILLDDVQSTKNDWRARNRIKTATGVQWLSVPVHHHLSRRINDILIDECRPWRRKHLNNWRSNYARTPFLDDVLHLLGDLGEARIDTLCALNVELVARICAYLGIVTPLLQASSFPTNGHRTSRLIDLLQQVKATTYLSGPSAADYLDMNQFRTAGIGLEYKTYDYLPYPQPWGEFDGAVSVLDLIANLGPEAKRHITSVTPNRRVLDPATPREVHPV